MDEGKLIPVAKKRKRLVKADPNVGLSWFIAGMGIVFAGFIVLQLISSISSLSHSSSISTSNRNELLTLTVSFALFLLIYIVLIVFVLWRLIIFMAQERRRQEAARGSVFLLADRQPDKEMPSIPSSLKIVMRFDWKRYAIFAGSFYIFLDLIFAAICLFSSLLFSGSISFGVLQFYLVGSFIGIVTALVIGVLLHPTMKIEIIADEEGLFINGLSKATPNAMKWQDARLFAIDILVAQQRNMPGPLLELASKEVVLRWLWLRSGSNPLTLYFSSAPFIILKPVAPYQEYDRQMQLLLAMIAEKTGLPLYDMRKKRVSRR